MKGMAQQERNDLICTTPRLCQNKMTPVALRGRGTTRITHLAVCCEVNHFTVFCFKLAVVFQT